MTKFMDVTARDMHGAAVQFESYVRDRLGFDYTIEARVVAKGQRFEITVTGTDKWQQDGRYEHRVGQLYASQTGHLDCEFEDVCKLIWEDLQKAMQRDERELRYGMKLMGGFIEHAPSFTSAVGKMVADRIKAARDEATNYMIEHHGWQAAE